ncbi:MAG: extracellular solute-binding protein [Proteobacteria bacterium]|nr:extracellular solute-binding protein [Pseudomonadota bacterium]MBU1738669.1 extracellular solute-binding protein [Pseudomonadota bacterium]
MTKTIGKVMMAVLLLGIFCGTATAAEMMKWTGCGITKIAFMAEAADAYKKKTGVVISLSGGGATKGIRAANSGEVDMGGNCRPSLPGKFPAEEGEVYLTVVAWDALVPIVQKDNPVDSITTENLKKVLQGEITNWKDLGGPDQKILLVTRTGKTNGVGYMARKIIFNDPDVDFAADALVLKSTGPVENKIKSDVTAFGLTGFSSAKKRVDSGESMKILAVDGHKADAASIASGSYSTFRPLFISTKGKPAGEVKAFLDWLLSDEGQGVVEAAGTASVRQSVGLKAKFKHWETTDRIVNFDSLP